MSSKAMREIANEYVTLIVKYTNERLQPFQQKLDAHAAVNGEFNKRLAELEAEIAELKQKLSVRRVA